MQVIHYPFSATLVQERVQESLLQDCADQYTITPVGEEACTVSCEDERAAAFAINEIELPIDRMVRA